MLYISRFIESKSNYLLNVFKMISKWIADSWAPAQTWALWTILNFLEMAHLHSDWLFSLSFLPLQNSPSVFYYHLDPVLLISTFFLAFLLLYLLATKLQPIPFSFTLLLLLDCFVLWSPKDWVFSSLPHCYSPSFPASELWSILGCNMSDITFFLSLPSSFSPSKSSIWSKSVTATFSLSSTLYVHSILLVFFLL